MTGGGPESEVRNHSPDGEARQCTAQAGQRRRYDIGNQKHGPDRDAEIFQANFVGMDCRQGMPKRAVQIAMHRQSDDHHEREAHIIQHLLEGRLAEGETEHRWDADRHAVGAARETIELRQQRVENHRDREVQHREEDGAVAHEKRAGRQAEGSAGEN
jgi:hypothetical protein